jgi:hypothetical protein
MADPKITLIEEEKGHVTFDCGDGRTQKAGDLFTDTADGIKANVARYCELYLASVPAVTVAPAEVTKMRAVEGKTFKIADVIAVEAVAEEVIVK